MTKAEKKSHAHAELRSVFEGSDTFDGWVKGVEKISREFNLNINLHEIELVCRNDLKGNVYEYCKKMVNNALL